MVRLVTAKFRAWRPVTFLVAFVISCVPSAAHAQCYPGDQSGYVDLYYFDVDAQPPGGEALIINNYPTTYDSNGNQIAGAPCDYVVYIGDVQSGNYGNEDENSPFHVQNGSGTIPFSRSLVAYHVQVDSSNQTCYPRYGAVFIKTTVLLSIGPRIFTRQLAYVSQSPHGQCVPNITTDSLPDATSFEPYGPFSLSAAGGSGQYSWSASGLPSTFFIYGNQLVSTGTAPTNPQTYQVTLTVTDTSSGQSDTRTRPLTVNPNYATVYLHRYYNSDPEVVDHFYTSNFQTLFCGRVGWFYEGTIGALATTPNSLRAPLYQYWNASIGDHFYTTNPNEVHPGDGNQFETIIGYVYVSPVSGAVKLYRWWSPDAADHLYTTDPTEAPVPPRPPSGSAPPPPPPPAYTPEGWAGYVLYPAPFADGCGDLHNGKVRHAIAHALDVKKQALTLLDFPTWVDAAQSYVKLRRNADSADTVLRDASYFLIGLRAATDPDLVARFVQVSGNSVGVLIYNMLKLFAQAGGSFTQDQLQLILQYWGYADQNPPSDPGGIDWFVRGLLAGFSGNLTGVSPENPVLPDPETSQGYESNLHFVVGDRGVYVIPPLAPDPIYLDPPLNTDVEWTLTETPDVFVRTIVLPGGSVPYTASFTVTVGEQTFPLVPGMPFDFVRDAGAADVSTFSVRALDEQSSGSPDYVLGVTFSGPAPFAWMKQKITPLAAPTEAGPDATPPALALPADVTMQAVDPSGVAATYTASAADAIDGIVPINCAPASGSIFSVGVTTVNCSATDSSGNTAVGAFTVTVTPLLFPGTDLGTYSGEVWAQLSGPYTWAVQAGSALPPGLALRTDPADIPPFFPPDAHAGIIGIPTVPGTYTFTLLRSGAPQDYRIKITPLNVKDYWTLPDAFVNEPYSYQLTALGNAGSVTWSATPSTLPPGVSLSPQGLFSGTPATAGVYNVSLQISDGVDTVYRSTTVNVYDVQITTPGSLPDAGTGVPYTAVVMASGGTGSFTFTADNLPWGLILSADGTISGSPAVGAAHWWFNVTATDTSHVSYTKTMSIVIESDPIDLPRIRPYDGELHDCTFGSPCINAVWVSDGGRAPFTWTASGLPPGMDIRWGSGSTTSWIAPENLEIWGTPTLLGSFNVRLTVTDADGRSATDYFVLKVSPLRVWSYLPNGTLGVPYAQHLLVIGGRPPYTGLAGGRLPLGLAFDPATLTVSGTPAENGYFYGIFDVADADHLGVRFYSFFSVGSLTSTLQIGSNDDLGTIPAGQFYSNPLSACCAPSYQWSLAGGSLPPGLTLSPDGLLSGTPDPPGGSTGPRYDFLVRVADAANPANFAVRQFSVIVTTLALGTFDLPFGNVGSPYLGFVTATGGSGSIEWGLLLSPNAGQLPPGLTIHGTGQIDGVPSASGRYDFELVASDGVGHFLLQQFSINVYPAGVNPPLSLTVGSSQTSAVGPFYLQLTASGGAPPYHYSVTPGAPTIPGMRVQDGQPLPTFFSASVTGGFIGVVTTPGTYNTSIRVADSAGQTFDRAITLTVSPLDLLSQTNVPKATVGAPYSFTLTPYGGVSYSWSAANLPPGLTLDQAGQISGMPTTSGTFFPSIALTDLTTTQSLTTFLTLTVDPFAIATAGVLPQGTAGTPYGVQLSAPGCAGCSWSVSGSLPSGMSLGAGGLLSGTPGGTFNSFFTVQASGGNGTTQKVFSLIIASATPQALTITTSAMADVTVGTSTAPALFASGGAPPYAWSLDSGSLPPGVSLGGPGETLGANLGPGFTYPAGRALQTGSYDFTLRVTDALNATASRHFTWTVSPLSYQYFNLPLAGRPLVYNLPYQQPLLVMGGTNDYAFSASGLPPGLVLDPATGVVSGAPTNTGFFNTPIQVADSAGAAFLASSTMNVAGPTGTTLGFTLGASVGTLLQGATVSFNIVPTGGAPPYVITPLSSMPSGFALLPLTGGGNPAGSQSLAGVALMPGTFSLTLQAQDTAGNIGVRTFTFSVAGFSLLSTALPDASVGTPYSYSLPAAGNAALWGPSGSTLPPGLTIASDGTLSGTPTTSGTFRFQLAANDGSVTATPSFTLGVSAIAIDDAPILPVAVVGQPYSHTFSGTGGGTKVWTAAGLPEGLTLSTDGHLSGIIGNPSLGGSTSTPVVTVADGAVPVSRRFTLFVSNPNPNVLTVPLNAGLLRDAVVGQAFSVALNVVGGAPPYSWSAAPGSALPPGLSLLTGPSLPPTFGQGQTVLGGAPTTPGQYSFDLVVTDTAGAHVRRTFTLNVSSIALVPQVIPQAQTGIPYAQAIVPVGGAGPYTFDLTAVNATSDMLPPGLSLTANGALQGTPTSTGNYVFVFHVQDSAGHTFARTFTLTVGSASGSIVTSGNPGDLSVGRGVVQQLTAQRLTGGFATYAWSVVEGALPPGVVLLPNAQGSGTTLLTGAPSASGTFVYTLRATNTANAADLADHTFTMHVSAFQVVLPPVAFMSAPRLPSGHVGEPYSATIKVAGGTPPYTFAVGPFSALPPGLALSPDGTLSGAPTGQGVFGFVLTISDAGGTPLTAGFAMVVTQPGVPAPLISFESLAPSGDGDAGVLSVGAPFVFPLDSLVQGGVAPLTWSFGPGSAVPPGLSILGGGTMPMFAAGLPTLAGDGYAFSLVVTDAVGQTLTIPEALGVSTVALNQPSLPPGVVGQSYSVPLLPSGGTPPYSIRFGTGSDLPAGLSLDPSGVLSGTPQAPGNFVIGVEIADSMGAGAGRQYNLTIDNAAGEAPAVNLSPSPVSIYYELGSATPAPAPVSVNATSGEQPFTLGLAGAPWASLDTSAGSTSAEVNLSVDASSLGAGTYFGLLGVNAPDAVNPFDAVPVVLTVAPPPPCSVTLIGLGTTASSAGGTVSPRINTPDGCSWVATASDPGWISVSPANGTGGATLSITISPNTLPDVRTGTVAVGGRLFAISQFGTSCGFSLSPADSTAPAGGGLLTVYIRSTCDPGLQFLIASAPHGDFSTYFHKQSTTQYYYSYLIYDYVLLGIPANPGFEPRVLTETFSVPPILGMPPTVTVRQAGLQCSAGLSVSSASAPAGGGTGAVTVTTPPICDYDTVQGPGWITVTSGGSGTGSGTLVYSVAPNTTGSQRSGALTIGGQPFTITQPGLACSVTLDTSGLGAPFGSTGGVGTIGVTTNAPSCSWSGGSGAPWARLTPASGTGSGTIIVNVDANPSTSARTATLTIAGQTIGFQQAGTTCTYALQSSGASVPGGGGAGAVGVIAPAACSWTSASSNPDWLAIVSAGSSGSSDVQFVAQPNPAAAPRTGSLTIAGLTYTVTQAPAICTYTLTPGNLTVAEGGASDSFAFSASNLGCYAEVKSDASWIHVTTMFAGPRGIVLNLSSGSVAIAVDPNPFAIARTGVVEIGASTFTVTELASPCGFSLNAYGASFDHAGGSGTVLASRSAAGCTPDTGTDQPDIVTLGPLVVGPAPNIFSQPFGVAPFPPPLTPFTRRMTITFGGQVFTVKQTSW